MNRGLGPHTLERCAEGETDWSDGRSQCADHFKPRADRRQGRGRYVHVLGNMRKRKANAKVEASSDLARPEYLTVEQFAAMTRRTPSAVRASIHRGDLPASKLGSRRWYIRRSDVDRMFDAKRN